ncbi:Protein of unknown function (DUF1521) [Paraburkholderia caribensis MBA4]|uniref:DUF1521 domain-containing protein n=1 Tax=Paraburkholderia caribensis MBA4 TaxID=1323664 RepID=A0A0P0RCX7_9BURK|nr:DUF1521 domain-containing protein [Paraburkholderia caribensis]ALL66370.1 Protein of unknown function (DUF1521) [Paraburkholderia caribensis MBA4]
MQATFDSRIQASFNAMPSAINASNASYQNMMQLKAASFDPSLNNGFMSNQRFDATSYSQQFSQTRNGVSASMSASDYHESSTRFGYEQTFSFTSVQYQQNNQGAYRRDSGSDCFGGQTNWSDTAVKDNKSSIDLGEYKLDLNKKDSSMTLTNKQNGDATKIWGDPHIDTNGTSGMFKGPLTFDLPDHTKVTVGTQAQGNASYADNVTITRGNEAYSVKGLSEKDSSPLTVERSHNGRELDAQTPDGYTLVANGNGKGWIDPQTGRAPTAADFNKH